MTSVVQHINQKRVGNRETLWQFHYRSFLVEPEKRKENFTHFEKKKIAEMLPKNIARKANISLALISLNI